MNEYFSKLLSCYTIWVTGLPWKYKYAFQLTCFPFFPQVEPQQSDLSNGGLLGVEDEDRCTLASFLSFLQNLPRATIRKILI